MSSQEFSTPIIQKILPDILNYLMNGPKNFLLEHSNYLLRKTLLEILSRFPFVELRPQLMKILPIFYHILEVCITFFIINKIIYLSWYII